MKYIKKIMFLGTLVLTSLQAQQPISLSLEARQVQQEDQTALNIIKSMQECIDFNQKAEQQINQSLNARQITEQKTAWEKIVNIYQKHITDLRNKHKDIHKSELTTLQNLTNIDANNQLMIQINEYRSVFAHLLNEYLVHLGQLYEKQGSFFQGYKTSYYISSKIDRSLSITPNEYALLIQTLDNATKQANWKQTVELSLLLTQADNSIIKKTLTLNEITTAIKQVPLPIGFSTTAVATGVAAAAALGAGAYYAYNAYNSSETPTANIPAPIEQEAQVEHDSWWDTFKGNAEINAQNADRATYAGAGTDSQLTPENLQNAETPESVTKAVNDYVLPAANIAAMTIPAAQLYKAGRAAGMTAALGVEKGIADFGVKKATVPSFPIAPSSTIKPVIQTTGVQAEAATTSSHIAQQFEHLPQSYIQPTTVTPIVSKSAVTPISPNWETYFGR